MNSFIRGAAASASDAKSKGAVKLNFLRRNGLEGNVGSATVGFLGGVWVGGGESVQLVC